VLKENKNKMEVGEGIVIIAVGVIVSYLMLKPLVDDLIKKASKKIIRKSEDLEFE